MRPRAFWILSALLICNSAIAQAAPPDRPGRGERPGAAGARPGGERRVDEGEAVRRLRAALELSSQQQSTYDELARKHLDALEELRVDGQKAADLADDYRDAVRNRDDAQVAALRPKVQQLRRQRTTLQDKFIADVRAVLDESQQKTLDEFLSRQWRAGRGGERGERGGNWERVLEGLPDRLEMTPEQRDKFVALLDERRTTLASHRESMQPLVQELRAARQAGETERVAELQAKIEEARAGVSGPGAFRTRLNEILTPEQRAKVDALWPQTDGAQRQPDARRMIAAARRLDLTTEQSDKLRELERSVRQQRGNGPDGPELRAERSAKLKADILAILTEPQKAEFETALQRLERGARRGGPDGSGAPGEGRRRGRGGRDRDDGVPPPPADPSDDDGA